MLWPAKGLIRWIGLEFNLWPNQRGRAKGAAMVAASTPAASGFSGSTERPNSSQQGNGVHIPHHGDILRQGDGAQYAVYVRC